MRLRNLGHLFRHDVEQVTIAVGKILDPGSPARGGEQANGLALGVPDRACDELERQRHVDPQLFLLFVVVDHDRANVGFQVGEDGSAQAGEQHVGLRYRIVVVKLVHREVLAGDVQVNDVQFEETRRVGNKLAQ